MKIVGDGVALTAAEHPVPNEPELDFGYLRPEALETVEIEIDESWIPTLEQRRASGKPLCPEDLVKIDGIVHVWMGDGWVALNYSKYLVWPAQLSEKEPNGHTAD